MKRLFIVAGLALAAGPAHAQFSSTTLRGVDVYRSEQVTVDQLRQKLGPLITEYARLRFDGRKTRVKETERLKNQIETEVKGMGRFAFAQIYFGDYVTSAERTAYITFDLVDAKDALDRMPFRAAPAGHVADAAGLIEVWRQYDALGGSLLKDGRLSIEDRPECPSFFCKWGSSTSELSAFEQKLAAGAEADKADLERAVLQDSDPARRVAALFALAYVQDGAEVSKAAADSLVDPAPEVRSAALSILSDIAIYHKAVVVDIGRIISALDYPTALERSKALGLLVALADSETYKSYLMTRATPKLVPLLRLEQPDNHDMAFTLLAVLSQESFGQRDYDAWNDWVQNEALKPPPPPEPKKKKRFGR